MSAVRCVSFIAQICRTYGCARQSVLRPVIHSRIYSKCPEKAATAGQNSGCIVEIAQTSMLVSAPSYLEESPDSFDCRVVAF